MPESADIKDNVVMNITLGPEKRLLKVALVGLGRMGFHHLRIIESNRMAKIVGIADPKILARADLVTDMQEAKHYYANGVEGRLGIEM